MGNYYTEDSLKLLFIDLLLRVLKILSHSEPIMKAMIENLMKYAEFLNITDIF